MAWVRHPAIDHPGRHPDSEWSGCRGVEMVTQIRSSLVRHSLGTRTHVANSVIYEGMRMRFPAQSCCKVGQASGRARAPVHFIRDP